MERYNKTRLRSGSVVKGEAPARKKAARNAKSSEPGPEDILSGDEQMELPFGKRKKRRA